MAVQSRSDNTNVAFILAGQTVVRESQTFLQDAGRATDLVFGTLVAQVAASKKWVPFTDETATDGTAIAKGIILDTIPAASLVAGDVVDIPVLVGSGCTVAAEQITIENSKTLDTVVGATTVEAHRVEDDLNEIGIFIESTVDIDGFEN